MRRFFFSEITPSLPSYIPDTGTYLPVIIHKSRHVPIPGMAALPYPPINNERTTIMAIKLIANYSKRLGLPGYSSHQFEVSIETEISNTSELAAETERLYGSLQAAVDAQIQQVGFVPDEHYGSQVTQRPALGASCSQTTPASSVRQTPPASVPETSVATVPAWKCSEKQQSLILELAGKAGLDDTALNELSARRFNKVVAMLNRMEASGLIDELMNRSGSSSKRSASGRNNYTRRPATAYAGNSNPY